MATAQVYTGVWTNWSLGRVNGATLTLSATAAVIFSAFLATFIGFVAIQLWKLLCFAIFQIRATKEPRDALHHQHQVILCNSVEPSASAWYYCQQAWSWRRNASRPFLRSAPLALFATLYFAGFSLLGILAPATITTAAGSDRLLVTSDNCGSPLVPTEDLGWQITVKPTTINSLSYAENCYGASANSSSDQCSVFQRTSIPWTAEQNTSCPFDPSVCLFDGQPGFKLSTPFIDSALDLGINAPPDQRITYQTSTTCTPLANSNDFVAERVGGQVFLDPGNDTWLFFKYGGDSECVNGHPTGYGTVIDCSVLAYNTRKSGWDLNVGYEIEYDCPKLVCETSANVPSRVAFAYAGNNRSSTFYPIPQLSRSDADIQLFLIQPNGMNFEYSNYDPIFSANLPAKEGGVRINDWFRADHYVSTIGCATQHQVCNPTTKKCTGLSGAYDMLFQALYEMDFSDEQLATFNRIFIASTQHPNMASLVYLLGADALQLQRTVIPEWPAQSGHISPLQWQNEVSNWFSIFLAQLQTGVYSYAFNKKTQDFQPFQTIYEALPNKTFDASLYQSMCGQQKTRSSQGTVSFSVLGVGLLFGLGGLIVLASEVTEPLLAFSRRKWLRGSRWKSLAWTRDNVLQLHRRAYVDAARWKGEEDHFPVTEKGDEFAAHNEVDASSRHVSETTALTYPRHSDYYHK